MVVPESAWLSGEDTRWEGFRVPRVGNWWYAGVPIGDSWGRMHGSEQEQREARAGAREAAMARRLTGELRCVSCGYELRGLSIREACPECGVPVRATLLGVVDPRAEELEPLIAPGVVAHGLKLWSVGALVACLCVWGLRIDETVTFVTGHGLKLDVFGLIGAGALALSGVGALVLLRPHRLVTRWSAMRAALGVSAYVPMVLIYWAIYRGFDVASPAPLISPGAQRLDRSLLRLAMLACVAIAIWGLRPHAIMLAMRSVIVRTGRVDRQSMYALLAVFLVAGVGDALNVGGVLMGGLLGDLLTQLHVVLVALGSVLVTLGMVNIVIDTVRLGPVLRHRGVGLSDVFETNRARERRSGV